MRCLACFGALLFVSACTASPEAPDGGADGAADHAAICTSFPPACPVLTEPALAWRVSYEVATWNGVGYSSSTASFDQSGQFEYRSSLGAAGDGGFATVTESLSDFELNRIRCLLENPQVRAVLASSNCTSASAPQTADGYSRVLVSAGGDYELWYSCGSGCDFIDYLRMVVYEITGAHVRTDAGN